MRPCRATVDASGHNPFAEVDTAAAASVLCEFLDQFAADTGVAAVKQRARDLLELGRGDIVLDVGCGTGDDTAGFATQVGQAGLAIAIDSGWGAIAETARRHATSRTRLALALAHGHRLPFQDASFDAVHCERVLIHDPRPDLTIAELVRIARVGAPVVAVEPDWPALRLRHGDPVTTGQVVHFAATHELVSAHVAGELVDLLAACRVGDLRTERHDVSLPFVLADMAMGFKTTVLNARHAGAVGDKAASWLEEIEHREADGTFGCVLPMTVAIGRKWRRS